MAKIIVTTEQLLRAQQGELVELSDNLKLSASSAGCKKGEYYYKLLDLNGYAVVADSAGPSLGEVLFLLNNTTKEKVTFNRLIAASENTKEALKILALNNGVCDVSYTLNRGNHSWVEPSYDGVAEFVDGFGKKWKAIGHRSVGRPDTVLRKGYIEFTRLD